jgi:hypothetical protein
MRCASPCPALLKFFGWYGSSENVSPAKKKPKKKKAAGDKKVADKVNCHAPMRRLTV